MNPLLLFGLLVGEKLVSGKNSGLILWGIIGFVIYQIFSGINKVIGLPGNVLNYIDSLLDKSVITDSEINQFESETGIVKYFTSNWYLERARKRDVNFSGLISSSSAMSLADEIYQAKGLLNDNENEVYAALSSIPNKLSLGFVSHNFESRYGENMYVYLRSFMGNKEMMKSYKIISPLKLT